MTRVACPACAHANARAARFCARCGFELARAEVESRRRAELAAARALVRAIAIVFIGTLAAVSVSALLVGTRAEIQSLASAPLLALVALGAARALGPGALRASFAHGTGLPGLAAGLAVGCVGFGLSWCIVALLPRTRGAEAQPFGADLALALLGLVVLAPLVEEWLCRGVLWLALRRALGTVWTVAVSAALFAFLHGLGGGGLLEYPHRFVLGLLLGALRARTNSLVPGLLAHALNNGLALAVALLST